MKLVEHPAGEVLHEAVIQIGDQTRLPRSITGHACAAKTPAVPAPGWGKLPVQLVSHPPQTIENRCVLDGWQHLRVFGKTALEPQLDQTPGLTGDLAQPVSQMSAGSRLRALQPYFRSMCCC